MEVSLRKPNHLPRFHRTEALPAFRVTSGDIDIIRLTAQHRFLRSVDIATLVNRSQDRTNDRLCKLYHAGYLDRPRAQLDRMPDTGSAAIVYALARRGAALLMDVDKIAFGDKDWTQHSTGAGRPFIEHQLGIVAFQVAMQRAAQAQRDMQFLFPSDILANCPLATQRRSRPLSLPITISKNGKHFPTTLVPDLLCGLQLVSKTPFHFFVEVDRGTMPVTRRNFSQSSFAKKLQAYLAVHAARLAEKQFAIKSFRVLTITTDEKRIQSMIAALKNIHVSGSMGASLFLFTTRAEFSTHDPLTHLWRDGLGKLVTLI
jgi:Replication-relaxation